jgi:hypothetical protein
MKRTPSTPTPSAISAFAWKLFVGFSLAGLFWTAVAWLITGKWTLTIAGTFSLVGFVFLVLCHLSPKAGRALLKFWDGLTLLLERTIGLVLLGGIYFFVLTPLGLLRRNLGNSPVKPGPVPGMASYWARVEKKKGVDRVSYLKQY